MFGTNCTDLIVENDACRGVIITEKDGTEREMRADTVVVATGRRGADWLEKICAEHNVEHKPGTVDIGVRVEVRNEIIEDVNRVLYESKLIGYPKPHFLSEPRRLCFPGKLRQ